MPNDKQRIDFIGDTPRNIPVPDLPVCLLKFLGMQAKFEAEIWGTPVAEMPDFPVQIIEKS